MSRLANYRGVCWAPGRKEEGSGWSDAKDLQLVKLELQQTCLQCQVERLQKLRSEIQNSRDRLQAIYQNVPIGFVTLNEKGVITEWNACAEVLLKPKKRGLLNAPLAFFVVDEDAGIFWKHLLDCKRAQGERIVSELRLKSGGRQVPVQIISVPFRSGNGKFFQTALIDLTERRKHERAREEAKEVSDAVIQTVHEPLLVLDHRLQIIRINEAFADLFGISQQLAKGLSLEFVLNLWWAGNELRRRLEEVLSRNVPLNDFELEVHPGDLGRRILLFNARRLQPRADSLPALVVAIEDITARKEAEEKLACSNQQLHQLAEELEERVNHRTRELRESNQQLEGFCYSIAHDLRAPLRAMAGFGAALLDDFAPQLGDRGRDYIERIIAAGEQMDMLIHDLLEFGRFNTTEFVPAPVNAEEVLSGVIDNLQPLIRAKRARVCRRGKLPDVFGHKVVLETVFSQLLTNAVKFVPPETRPEVTIWPEEQGEQVRIWIADNGIGIEPEYHQKIFEVFQRLHSRNVYPGTGIGLAIVRRALQRTGGCVGVESAPGKGSRFWVTLPGAGESKNQHLAGAEGETAPSG